MPYRDPSPEDPTVLVGVRLPGNRDGLRRMAAAFAEEFAAMGFPEERILGLFRRPAYAGPHRAYRALGEAEVTAIVRESLGPWARFRVRVEDAPAHDGRRSGKGR